MKNISIWIAAAAFLFVFNGSQRQVQEPYFTLASQKIFNTDETPSILFQGSNIAGDVNFKIYQITNPAEFFATRYSARAPVLLQTEETQKEWANILAGFPVLNTWDEFITPTPERWFSKEISLGIKKPGVYFVEARYRKKFAHAIVLVSPYALLTKQSKSQLLTYIVDRKSGNPISNAKIFVYQLKEKLAEGNSTKDGLFYTTLPPIKVGDQQLIPNQRMRRPVHPTSRNIIVMGEKENNFIIADPYYYVWGLEQPFLIYTYTDRPVYRPSQEVFFKGIVRKKDEKGNLQNVPNKLVKVTIRDSRGGEILHDSLYTNQNGTYNGKLLLADEPPLGVYNIQTDIEGASTTAIFEVQEYKKPEFEVTVTSDKKQYSKGETITATIDAKYYFGSPVINADVEYQISRSSFAKHWYTEYATDIFYKRIPYNEQIIYVGSGKLDKDGKLKFTHRINEEINTDYTYEIEAKVTDQSRRTISGTSQIKVTRALFTLAVQADKYVYKLNDQAKININISDFEGVGIETNYELTVSRDWWDRLPRIQNGRTTYDYKRNNELVLTMKGKTGKIGIGETTFDLKQTGYFSISVSAVDKIGNKITESIQIYCAEKNMTWWGDVNTGIQIIPDKQSYLPGETMRVFVVMPIPDISVLITAEGERLIDYRVEHINGSAKVIEIPLKNTHTPDFHLGVNAIANDNLYQQTKMISVVPQDKFLNIEIVNDKKLYKPAESGVVTIKVRDQKGKAVQNAELSLGIVDESIYAIASEKVQDIKDFFYTNRNNLVQTHTSLYFNFYGYSQPDLMTTAESMGTRTMQKGMDYNEPSEKHKKIKFVEAVLRKDFRDAMFWSPVIFTDENGIAKVNVKYPDNLTTWRATVRAVTNDTKVGSFSEKVTVRKNLLVRVETPRFLTQRDTTAIAVIVHNYLSEDKLVKVNLTSDAPQLIGKEKTILVPKNGEVRVDWKLAAVKSGTVKLTAKTLTDEESDAMQISIPILPHGIQIAQSQIVDLQKEKEQKSVVITIPNEAEMTTAKLSINLSPSIASTILTALDDLVGYPYGCVEQTMSRFLPTIVVANVLHDLNAPIAASKKAELPKMVETGLKRLYALQHQDGGWGWWENDNTDAFMSSYVVYGLTLAKTAGYSISSERLNNGIGRIENLLSSSDKLDPTTEAYAIYVLAFAGANGININKSIIENRLARFDFQKANNYTRSLAALSYNYSGDKTKTASLVQTIENDATQTGTAVFWSGKSCSYNWQDDNVETTAFALKALLAAGGSSELVQKAVQFLIKQKQENSWMSTKQSAMVIFALVDYLKMSKELEPDYLTTITVNDKKVLTRHISKADIFDKEIGIEITSENLKNGINTIRIEKSGFGRLYTTAKVTYYSREENIEAAKSGFAVQRDYFKLVREYDGNEYIYKKTPLGKFIKSGDELLVKITVASDANYEYFMLEDPLL
ncbi:MAG: MG2 domain-containing protein, partial [Bacteroidota bacterium]|nr:MG2 domain-containing protein [Bacteroidota bacterium]